MEETTTRTLVLFSPHSALARLCRAFWRAEDGATLVEYVLLVALVAAVAVGTVTLLGVNASAKLGTASDALK